MHRPAQPPDIYKNLSRPGNNYLPHDKAQQNKAPSVSERTASIIPNMDLWRYKANHKAYPTERQAHPETEGKDQTVTDAPQY